MNTNAIEARAALRYALHTGNVDDCGPALVLATLVDECSELTEETRATLYQWLTDQLS